jgi:hypothetical protein
LRALQTLQRDFGKTTRHKGEIYFRQRRVHIIDHDSTRIRAHVQGSYEYEVNIGWDGSEYTYDCTCPHFEDHGQLCKHLWATILTADARNLLPSGGATGNGHGNDQREDDDDDRDDEFVAEPRTIKLANQKVKFLTFREQSEKPEQKRHAVWRRRLAELRSDWRWQHTAPSSPWPKDKQIVYALLPDEQDLSESLSIGLYSRWSDKTELKRLRLQVDQIATLPDPLDRQLIAMLFGLATGDDFDMDDRTVPNELTLRDVRDAVMVLKTITQSGRCVLAPNDDGNNFEPLEWDDAESWRFHLVVTPDATGDAYRLHGIFKRADQQMEIPQPRLIVQGGLIVSGSKIASLQDDGAFRFIRLFRHENALTIPREQGHQLLEELFQFPRVPAIDLPEAMQITESRGTPRPRLTFSAPRRGLADNLCASLAFDYAGTIVPHAQEGAAIFDSTQRRILHRDGAAEAGAEALLRELGFRMDTAGEDQTPAFRLVPRRLPNAVRALTAQQWHVEVNGKIYRQPGKLEMKVSSGIDWFELQGNADFEGVSVKLPALLQAISKGEATVVLDDGTVGILPEQWLKRYGLLAAVTDVKDETIQFNKSQVGLLDALLAEIPDSSVDEAFAHARDQLRKFQGVRAVDPPQSFVGSLRPYQREGLGWIEFLRSFGLNGCLADDMGLGKTVQVLAMLEQRRLLGDAGPSLVVVPRSLVFNWQQEAIKFAPGLRVLNHATTDRLKTTQHFSDFDLILTTYGTLRNDVVLWKDLRFDYVILDEAQAIKNAQSESAKAARLLRANHRLALSGTPVQNHLGELWSLLEFLNPGMLGASRAFASITENADRAATIETRQFLAGALRPFILRRTKEQVAADLPEKFEQTIFCELDKKQRALYAELKEHYRQSLLTKIEADGLGKSKLQVLEALLRLRQAACHPGLLNKSRIDEASAKLDTLMPRLAEVADEGHKTLVFSQFTSFLAIVRKKLDEQGVVYEYLDGKTRDRQQHVDRFQTDESCKLFLISLKAGGLGLNLTAAQYVFLLDPWWNPAIEAQAIDRAHRIGQTRQVFAYRLIARDTVEEKVLQLQQSKRDLADAIINADNALISKLGREDLELLLS